MQPSDTTISVAHFGIRLRPIRIAEFSMFVFLAVTMGLPLFFLLIGSFNLAPPGKETVMDWIIGSELSPTSGL